MTKRELTCIVCPRGCRITAELDGKKLISVSGNSCNRGKAYAENECIAPMRTITTTVKTSGGGVVSVKTETVIPKEKMLESMAIINSAVAKLPVKVGDVIIENVFGSRVIATQNKEAE